MLIFAALIGLIFVIGIIFVIGWLIVCNIMGQLNVNGTNFIETFCNCTTSLGSLFTNIQTFVQNPQDGEARHNLHSSIKGCGEIIGAVSNDKNMSENFVYLFNRKVSIYSRKIKSKRRKEKLLKKLEGINNEIGQLFNSPTIGTILNSIDKSLIFSENKEISVFVIKGVNAILKSIGVDLQKIALS